MIRVSVRSCMSHVATRVTFAARNLQPATAEAMKVGLTAEA